MTSGTSHSEGGRYNTAVLVSIGCHDDYTKVNRVPKWDYLMNPGGSDICNLLDHGGAFFGDWMISLYRWFVVCSRGYIQHVDVVFSLFASID